MSGPGPGETTGADGGGEEQRAQAHGEGGGGHGGLVHGDEAGGHARGCGVEAGDRLGRDVEGAVLEAAPGVDDGAGALLDRDVDRADDRLGGAGGRDGRRDGAGRQVQALLRAVGQTTDDGLPAGEDVDLGAAAV
ncbi:hypothetical protein SAMN05216184_111117 [Georgenia satyanarayanai]|uniref:Uncharacterized protein n=1 Tax=Georgenia satyanarayanai TaxID=860221 RepID=A0A2Y9ARL2_9MICO|nr:hypothetical protein A8987_111117 [Georgenia satyanarayanai]SSA45137.1 hypothetical protein SAMN05216184_111117 [Georgenia satyanarayanai]